MDLLKKFDTQASYDASKDSLEYPTVSYVTENDLVYFMQPQLYEWVDLGLPSGLKWAAWNVGATKPEEYGLYFAWGETQGYTGITDEKQFSWSEYKFSVDGSESNFGKYNSTDGLTTLESSDDAASASQSTCRMPTKADCEELTANTTSAWTEDYNGSGVSGVILTSTKEGYTDKSIFIPATGFCGNGSLINDIYYCFYWFSSLFESNSPYAWCSYFHSSGMSMSRNNRYLGQSVRAVKK